MIDREGNPPPVDRGQLIAVLDRVKTENNLDDAQLSAALNRNPGRHVGNGGAGPDNLRIDARLLRTLREGDVLNEVRLHHIAEALHREFKLTLPRVGTVQGTSTRKLLDRIRQKTSKLPLGKLAGIGASLAVLTIYLCSNADYRSRFEGIAAVVSVLPVILACFIAFDHYKRKS